MGIPLSKEQKVQHDAKFDKMHTITKEIRELFNEGECSLLWLLSNSLLRTVLESQTSGRFDCMSLAQLFNIYQDAYRSENPDCCETCYFNSSNYCTENPREHTKILLFRNACSHYRRDDEFEN